jgi:hypothetical protein
MNPLPQGAKLPEMPLHMRRMKQTRKDPISRKALDWAHAINLLEEGFIPARTDLLSIIVRTSGGQIGRQQTSKDQNKMFFYTPERAAQRPDP